MNSFCEERVCMFMHSIIPRLKLVCTILRGENGNEDIDAHYTPPS